jgi:glycosyltransferase involved in cell wall biosynthesis
MTDEERPFLTAALRSVENQAVASRIILCVADDNKWIDGLLGKDGEGIELMRLRKDWPSVIRNQAIAAVKTQFVAFLDGDDLWESRKLDTQFNTLDALELDVVATQHILIREDGAPYFFGFAHRIPMTSSWLGKTEVFGKHPFEQGAIGQDVGLWEQLLADAEVRTGIVDAFLIRYRVREVSISSPSFVKRRKLAYAHRSQHLGVQAFLLTASYAANTWFRLGRTFSRQADGHVRAVRSGVAPYA